MCDVVRCVCDVVRCVCVMLSGVCVMLSGVCACGCGGMAIGGGRGVVFFGGVGVWFWVGLRKEGVGLRKSFPYTLIPIVTPLGGGLGLLSRYKFSGHSPLNLYSEMSSPNSIMMYCLHGHNVQPK